MPSLCTSHFTMRTALLLLFALVGASFATPQDEEQFIDDLDIEIRQDEAAPPTCQGNGDIGLDGEVRFDDWEIDQGQEQSNQTQPGGNNTDPSPPPPPPPPAPRRHPGGGPRGPSDDGPRGRSDDGPRGPPREGPRGHPRGGPRGRPGPPPPPPPPSNQTEPPRNQTEPPRNQTDSQGGNQTQIQLDW